ncbi:TetR/AcrR family transcriptional regulator [Amycolatopsis regifaucium]|uniref:TetR family transcriptional regulator n=1 Tax=Amycolatopsis regifaucium TaxID=546365 RepID=A0A154MJF2_9PSEU|nr:TetR/AcrR family transcriptional regulator [Amycolatopsis regifaucium]KZB83559.1 TetR family transcriptional regulator [Amycolatopsis regifaucium]OKA03329.1 TetR family transcriptional regulator [Amycolatopsis regifaucium]SFJ61716.1 DNA-binding transcriptional regulator, AcrR family [Amycolatopsis regifaucium]
MPPKPAATEVKAKLIEAAIRLLSHGGPEALQARKLAAEIGASTMAVYTHFGGMGALVDEVAREGFRRLSANLAKLHETDDPVADILTLALAYRRTVVENPQLYAVTFGQSQPNGQKAALGDMTDEETRKHLGEEGIKAFNYLLRAASRVIEAGRFRPAPEFAVAAQLWSALHGYITLEVAGHFGTDDHGVDHILVPLAVTLGVGLGDTLEAATRSAQVSIESWRAKEGNDGT